jgi:adenylate cyclase, class 2
MSARFLQSNGKNMTRKKVRGCLRSRVAGRSVRILRMSSAQEVEIKFRVDDLNALSARLPQSGFRLVTPRTHEMNTLYDFADGRMRARGEVLRIRKYGEKWTVTHKSKGMAGKHKSRLETETQLAHGEALARIFESLGLAASFRYEKYRAEWSDDQGHVVLDETPIGNIAELEGPPEWIDRTAEGLGIKESEYITLSYAQMFYDWRQRNRSQAKEMTWKEVGERR